MGRVFANQSALAHLVDMKILEVNGGEVRETKAQAELRDRNVALFNEKIAEGITWLRKRQRVGEDVAAVVAASILIQHSPDVSKPKTAEEMRNLRDEVHVYAQLIKFSSQRFNL